MRLLAACDKFGNPDLEDRRMACYAAAGQTLAVKPAAWAANDWPDYCCDQLHSYLLRTPLKASSLEMASSH
jgi:hypothetical protein